MQDVWLAPLQRWNPGGQGTLSIRYVNTFKALTEGLVGLLSDEGHAKTDMLRASQQMVVSAFFPRKLERGDDLSCVEGFPLRVGAVRDKTWVSHFVNERAVLSIVQEFLTLHRMTDGDDAAAGVLSVLEDMFKDGSVGLNILAKVCESEDGSLSERLNGCLVNRLQVAFACVYGADSHTTNEFRRQMAAQLGNLEELERTAKSKKLPSNHLEERWMVLRHICACGIAGHLAVRHCEAGRDVDSKAPGTSCDRSETPHIIAGFHSRGAVCKNAAHLLRIKSTNGMRQVVGDYQIDDDCHVVTVGRHVGLNDVSTKDAGGVSGKHLRIERGDTGWRIVQGRTKNGTLVIFPDGHRRFLAMEGSVCTLECGSIICCAPLCTPGGERLLNYDNGAVFRFEID